MTNDRQLEQEAAEIYRKWTAPAPAPTSPAQAYIADVMTNRPLGPHDVGMLQALGHYGTATWAMNRDQKLERRRLTQHLRHPDLTGLSYPDLDALNRHPDIAALFEGRTSEDSEVRERVQREIAERSNPRPALDPDVTAAIQRIAAKQFVPKKAPRS